MFWPEQRADYLNNRLSQIVAQPQMTYCFVPSPSSNFLRYFSEGVHRELKELSPDPFSYLEPFCSEAAKADIVIHISSGKEEDAARIWDDRRNRSPDTLCVLWLWDNHTWGMGNRQVVTAADIAFASHGYISDYLVGAAALLAGHVPACSAQWTRAEATNSFLASKAKPREHKMLFNYVDYGDDYPLRRRSLEALASGVAPIENLQMTRHDKSRYFSLSREARLFEWMRYKVTVIVPVDRDLSTRVFDSLLAGQIPIIPENIPDIDHVIPRELQAQLGVVRVPDLEVATVQAALDEALERFDEMGTEGTAARHDYALQHHMLVNRITSILETIWRIGSGEFSVTFGKQAETWGLLLKRN